MRLAEHTGTAVRSFAVGTTAFAPDDEPDIRNPIQWILCH